MDPNENGFGELSACQHIGTDPVIDEAVLTAPAPATEEESTSHA